jgi:hypothetical protein
MDAAIKADELTAHIVNPHIRSRVRNSLYKQLMICEAIQEVDDTDTLEEPTYIDGCDDIPVVTIENLNQDQDRKMEDLRSLHRIATAEAGTATATIDPIDAKGQYGYTALHRAVIAADVAEVRSLLQRHARVEITDASGFTALERARMRKTEPGMDKIINMLRTR